MFVKPLFGYSVVIFSGIALLPPNSNGEANPADKDPVQRVQIDSPVVLHGIGRALHQDAVAFVALNIRHTRESVAIPEQLNAVPVIVGDARALQVVFAADHLEPADRIAVNGVPTDGVVARVDLDTPLARAVGSNALEVVTAVTGHTPADRAAHRVGPDDRQLAGARDVPHG